MTKRLMASKVVWMVFVTCFWGNHLTGQSGITNSSAWKFISGDSLAVDLDPVYGTQQMLQEGNMPGARHGAITWTDSSGNLWLFGGNGVAGRGFGLLEYQVGYLNDLWKYDISISQWIFMKGDNVPNIPGIYGIKNIADDDNKPGGRSNSVSWVDSSGNLFLFGGYGYYTGGTGLLNDLWKYSIVTNQWTWIGGDNSKNVSPVYGDKGVATNETAPGGRSGSIIWKDKYEKIWLFGGSNSFGFSNDLWTYDQAIKQWTWIRGDSIPSVAGTYGTMGQFDTLNNPGARDNSLKWVDNAGNFWLFGGFGVASNGVFEYNDLWKYDPVINKWAWVSGVNASSNSGSFGVKIFQGIYGIQGVANSNYYPGSREESVSWTDDAGKLWLFGGHIKDAIGPWDFYNDIWKFDPVTSQWAWIKGDSIPNSNGVSGTKTIFNALNNPQARWSHASWKDKTGKIWMFGGRWIMPITDLSKNMSDFWQYDPLNNQWAWMKGDLEKDVAGSYGEQGKVADGNRPGPRNGAVSWKDATGNQWLFGGTNANSGNSAENKFSDLWKYNAGNNQWIWMKGNNTVNTTGSYGTIGIASDDNAPGSRTGSISWLDNSGNLWLFGGDGYGSSSSGILNDLWKYNTSTNQWTWISGNGSVNEYGVYGTIDLSATTNKPGARKNSISWTDNNGKLWLLGGAGYSKSGSAGILNDLWKYDPVTGFWTWIKGDSIINVPGIYGTRGAASSNNKPGARENAVSWRDNSGNLWLSGGNGYATNQLGFLDDLWTYTISTKLWTWMKGTNAINASGFYGVKGIFSANNNPGGRESSISWKDNSGKLWLYGGYGTAGNDAGFLNDLWKYDPSLNQWVWLSGDTTLNNEGVPGQKGVASANNKPKGKKEGISWTDNSGSLWMYAGVGPSYWGNLDDLWQYNPTTNFWTWVKGQTYFSDPGKFGSRGIFSKGSKPAGRASAASWTDSTGNLWLFGGESVLQTNPYRLNDLWKFEPLQSQWTWMKGDSLPNQPGIYGTKGVENLANNPGAREGCISWRDDSDNLWLFGGNGVINTGYEFLNDLWKFNPVTKNWTWISGDNTGNTTGVYLSKNVPGGGRKPGARSRSVSWKDQNNNLWLFGGNNADNNVFNDLWKFNLTSKEWTWISGDSSSGNLGFYGTKGFASPLNKPGARINSTGWSDNNGRLWLFGGDIITNGHLLNDLWRFDPASNQWAWISGDTTVDHLSHGLQGIADSAGAPGGRANVCSWIDLNGNFFLFSGYGYSDSDRGYLNDLWKYSTSTNKWTFINANPLYAHSEANRPGARYQSATWADRYGDLWLMGGFGVGSSGRGHLSDLWKIYSGSKYVFIGDGNWSDSTQWYQFNRPPTTITPGMDVTIDHLIPGVCTNQGPITVLPFGRLRIESGKRLDINQGALVNDGSIIGPGNRPGKLKFTGDSTNALRSAGSITTPIILSDNKRMVLSGNTNTSRLELYGGSKLTLKNFDLKMDTASIVSDSTSFIITDGTGTLSRKVTGQSTIFPVGTDSTSYSPIMLQHAVGTSDSVSVRVAVGVRTGGTIGTAITTGNVNRTWFISDSSTDIGNNNVKIYWDTTIEQAGFSRKNSYVAQLKECPLPVNCVDYYYDRAMPKPASGTQVAVQDRDSVTGAKAFIVRSSATTYIFTGNGSWDDPANWTIGIVPSLNTVANGRVSRIIQNGTEVIINYSPGSRCQVNGDIIIERGGKLTIQPGKLLEISGNIKLEN